MIKKLCLFCMKLLGAGLAVHFLMHTVVTYGLGVDMVLFRAWKEILVGLLGLGLVGGLLIDRSWFLGGDKKSFLYFCLCLLLFLLVVWSGYVSVFLYQQSLIDWLMAVRYDFFGMATLLIVRGLVRTRKDSEEFGTIVDFFIGLLKVLLVLGLVWYVIVNVMPEMVSWLGYSVDAWQWVLGEAPPVRYLTQVWWGYVRNQGLFGGPVSWGLYLIAFFPLFVVYSIKDRTLKVEDMGLHSSSLLDIGLLIKFFWIGLYVLNLVLTFSRVVWGVLLLEILVLFFVGRKKLGPYILGMVISVCVGVGASVGLIAWMGAVDVPVAADRDQGVFSRDLSDKGHVELLVEGVGRMMERPIYGWGAGGAGPASYRIDQGLEGTGRDGNDLKGEEMFFNTENQYVQIGVEWGLVGLVLYLVWFCVLLWLLFLSIASATSQSLGLGLLGLLVAGMVQHSLVDVQVVLSVMLVCGVVLHIRD